MESIRNAKTAKNGGGGAHPATWWGRIVQLAVALLLGSVIATMASAGQAFADEAPSDVPRAAFGTIVPQFRL